MHSLTTHLCAGDAHDGLPFHSSCPICRERRLHGDIVLAPVLPVRTQVALVATVIAVGGTGMPAAAIAAEQDSTDDGTAQVSATAPADPATSSDYDPGGGDDSLPTQAPSTTAPAPAPAASDDGPADAAPTADESDPVVDSGDGQADTTTAAPTTPAAPAAASPAPTPAPAAPVTPAPSTDETSAPPAAAPVPAQPVPAPAAAPALPSAVKTTTVPAPTRPRHKSRTRQAARRVAPVVAPAAAAVQVPGAAVAAASPVSSPARVAISSSDATHVVRPGESLWAIAASLAGPRATPAAIAREVHHLWSLNAQRIGTGNPDLLMVGTRLRLR